MSDTGFSGYIQKNGGHHPILKGLVVLFIGITLLLGLLHDGLIAGEVSIVFVQRFKREASDIAGVYRRLKKEFTTWDQPNTDEPVPAVNPKKLETSVHADVAKSR